MLSDVSPFSPMKSGTCSGRDAVARLDALGRVDVHVGDAARRHHQADVLAAELERVAVGRDDARLDPLGVGARRERRDHVVGLPALELEVAVAERLDDRPEMRELLAQQVRHRLAAFLVDDVGRLGDRGAVHRARVPRDGDALRPVVREQLEEHVREAEQRVRRLPVGRRELLGQREERAVGEVVAVDDEEVGVARRRVVEVELGSRQGLRHRAEGIVRRRCRSSRFTHFPRTARTRPPGCSPSATRASAPQSRCCPRSTTSHAHVPERRRRSSRPAAAKPSPTWRGRSKDDIAPRRLRRLRGDRAGGGPRLFAALAERWEVARFAVAVPAADASWSTPGSRLAFGCQFVWAVRETALDSEHRPPPFAGTIRAEHAGRSGRGRGVRRDPLDAAGARRRASRGWRCPPPRSSASEWSDLWDDPETFVHFVAERDGRAVGHAVLYRRPEGDLRVPPGNIDLAHAATLAEVRGTGVGLALTRARHRLGARARLPLDHDRLAVGQPALVALLAASRLPAAVPPPLPGGPRDAVRRPTLALFCLAVDRARSRAGAGGHLHRHAERRQGPARGARLGARRRERRARARRRGDRRDSRR